MGQLISHAKYLDNEKKVPIVHRFFRHKIVPKPESIIEHEHNDKHISPLSRHGMTHSRSFDSIFENL